MYRGIEVWLFRLKVNGLIVIDFAKQNLPYIHTSIPPYIQITLELIFPISAFGHILLKVGANHLNRHQLQSRH